MSLGFLWGLVVLGSIRELLGFRTILGFCILPEAYTPMAIMVLPAGAFLVLGGLVACMRLVERKKMVCG
jgi:electron transport complex protein RnfE